MYEGNNVRNRWRRYRDARRAYNFTVTPFREWAHYGLRNPDSYSAEPHHLNWIVSK